MLARLQPDTKAHAAARVLLTLLPLLPGASAVFVIGAAPFAWGAAAEIDAPDWAPTSLALSAGLMALAVVAGGVRALRPRLAGGFNLDLLSAGGGTILLAGLAYLLVGTGVGIGNPDSYGDRVPVGGLLFLVLGFAMAAFLALLAWAGCYLLRRAIEPHLARFERPPDAPDAMGTILEDRRR